MPSSRPHPCNQVRSEASKRLKHAQEKSRRNKATLKKQKGKLISGQCTPFAVSFFFKKKNSSYSQHKKKIKALVSKHPKIKKIPDLKCRRNKK